MLYEADQRFKELYYNQYKYYGYYGGRASGKSYAIADYAIIAAISSRENILTVREFGNALDDSSHRLYVDRIETLGLSSLFQINSRSIICKANGSRFVFLGLERNPDKIRSFHDATLTIVEEAQNISEYVFRVLIETVLRNEKSRIVCVWNPIYPTDAVDFFFRGSVTTKDTFQKQVNYEGNKFFQDTGLHSQIERMKKIDYNKYLHVWEGEYYNVMNARILTNVRYVTTEEINIEGTTPVYGVDFGTTDPNSFIRAYVLDDYKIYIDLAFKKVCLLEELTTYIKQNISSSSTKVVCDSAWKQSIEILRKNHINAIPANKGPNSVLTGLDWLQNYEILLHPRAKFFMEEAINYTWKIDRKQINIDGTPMLKQEPIDKHNHLIDALRYATECCRITKPKYFTMEI